MPSVPTPDAGTKSGIITSDSGERHIPSSVRPDGSKRKEIKIRPGYRPPEDVEVYKNRTAEAWKTRAAGGIPGADSDAGASLGDGKASNKNAKRREARKKAKALEDGTREGNGAEAEANGASSKESGACIAEKDNGNDGPAAPAENKQDPEVEKEKQIRSLKKKLRQARDLREKKDKGGSLLPEQFEKVIKINELIRQLDAMGFDADGEPKKT